MSPLFVYSLISMQLSTASFRPAMGWNEALGIDARVFAGLDQFAYWFGFQCKLLPIYALATRICPPGVEATMIAMVLSLKNLGETVASYYGAGLTTLAGIDYNECGAMPFDNLYLLYLWRIVCRLMPAAIILVIPTEAQIVHAMEALARHEKALGGGAEQRDSGSGLALDAEC